MNQSNTLYRQIERTIEISIGLLLVSGLIIINLPIIPTPNKPVIYVTAAFVTLFAFLWHRIKIPLSIVNKNFIEAAIYVVVIALVVHATGGTRSYFNFLYLLPILNISTSSKFWRTSIFWLLATGFIFSEALLFEQPLFRPFPGFDIPQLSLAALNSWAVGLIAVYGHYISSETETAQTAATEATVGKEKAVNKLKDEFLFIVAHELRGPITAIRGYLELFIEETASKMGGDIKKLAANAFLQSERLNDLIFELLDVSRLEVGKLKLSTENFDINIFLQDIINQEKEIAATKKIDLSFEPAEKEVMVYADKERVKEIIRNLIDNAIKYTGELGKVWVGVDTKGHEVYVAVADTGVGIAVEEIPNLFDRFHQSVGGEKKGEVEIEKSAGLGLFLAKNLVYKMGGKIFVKSQLGKGSKFTFTLPLGKRK
ncbi:MAG: HAMP domain-containing sensor histidine kinase [Candidatus Woykebacteria bacterium]